MVVYIVFCACVKGGEEIDGVFADKAYAERYCKRVGAFRVEEHEVRENK